MSIATTSAAPRRSISNAQKPSKVPTSRQRRPASEAGRISRGELAEVEPARGPQPRRQLERVVPLAALDLLAQLGRGHRAAHAANVVHAGGRRRAAAIVAAMAALELSAAREQAELEEYLGAGFELRRLQDYERELEREFAGYADERAFYRESEAYLYNLTAFAMTQTKLPYLRELVRLVAPGARLLDYGCGIGSDGLALLEAGYRVEFADFDNPSDRLPALAPRPPRARGARSGTSSARSRTASTPPTPST